MQIKTACVVGAGAMGRQIALNTAIYSYQVNLVDSNPIVLDSVRQWSADYLAGRVTKGRKPTGAGGRHQGPLPCYGLHGGGGKGCRPDH